MDNWGYLARPLLMTAAIFRFLFRPCGVLAGTDSRSSQRYHRSRHAVTPALVELESRLAPAIDMAMVTIGNPANTPDPATGHGAVAQEYRIGKYEVTLGQYCAFLNAVADVSDDYRLYNAAMERVASSAGILRAGEAGNYSYTVAGPLGSVVPPGADSPADRPIANVNWFNAARFANWISNGQPDEGTPEQLTENGAYKLQGATMSLYAFDPKFLGGVSVSGGTTRVGDEWTTVILCGAGSGSEPAVSVFDAVTGASRGAFYAFSPAYKGGVRIALSQPLADGTSYAVVSSTINSHLVVFDLADYATPMHSFYAFPSEIVSAGFTVASADLDLDGTLEIVAGVARQGNSSQVAIMDLSGRLLKQGNVNFPGGVAIAVNDADRNGRLDIVAASGPGIPGQLSTYDYADWSLIDSLFISDSLNGVAAATNFARA